MRGFYTLSLFLSQHVHRIDARGAPRRQARLGRLAA